MSTPKAGEICCAMRPQPNLGLRRFNYPIAAMSSIDGPLGPGFRRRAEEENSRRYFRATSAWWNLSRVAGLMSTPHFRIRRGLRNRAVSRGRLDRGGGDSGRAVDSDY